MFPQGFPFAVSRMTLGTYSIFTRLMSHVWDEESVLKGRHPPSVVFYWVWKQSLSREFAYACAGSYVGT
jgi:hypothetical protein